MIYYMLEMVEIKKRRSRHEAKNIYVYRLKVILRIC